MVVREIPAHLSPETVKNLKKQRQHEDPLDKVIVESNHGSDSERSDIRIDDY